MFVTIAFESKTLHSTIQNPCAGPNAFTTQKTPRGGVGRTPPHENRHTSPSQGMSCLSRKCFMSDSHPSTQPTDCSLASWYAGLRQRTFAATCVHMQPYMQPYMPTRRPHWGSGSRGLSTYARGIRGTRATSPTSPPIRHSNVTVPGHMVHITQRSQHTGGHRANTGRPARCPCP